MGKVTITLDEAAMLRALDRLISKRAAPEAGGSFAGFCDACGGFRKHRLACPVLKRPPS